MSTTTTARQRLQRVCRIGAHWQARQARRLNGAGKEEIRPCDAWDSSSQEPLLLAATFSCNRAMVERLLNNVIFASVPEEAAAVSCAYGKLTYAEISCDNGHSCADWSTLVFSAEMLDENGQFPVPDVMRLSAGLEKWVVEVQGHQRACRAMLLKCMADAIAEYGDLKLEV